MSGDGNSLAEGVLMAWRDAAEHHLRIAEDWLEKHGFVLWAHPRKSRKDCGYLLIHRKGEKDIFVIFKYDEILPKRSVTKEMLPDEWVAKGELEIYSYFYRVTEIFRKEISFDDLLNSEGQNLEPGSMRDLVRVKFDSLLLQ